MIGHWSQYSLELDTGIITFIEPLSSLNTSFPQKTTVALEC